MCCGQKALPPVSVGSACPGCGKFVSNAKFTVQCPVCKLFFIPKKKQ